MRYVTRPPKAEWFEAVCPPLPHPQVFSSDPINTGVLNASGHQVYRIPDEIGFVPRRTVEKR